MHVIYSKHFNYNLGLLRYLHPFEGTKFKQIFKGLAGHPEIGLIQPEMPVSSAAIEGFLSPQMREKVSDKQSVFNALEVPSIPFIPFCFLDRKILSPMRWGVAGTLLGAENALSKGGVYWNLSGGYHHAMPQSMEGFCIYNDIGICYQQLLQKRMLSPEDNVLIIDTDAHHGNGNAQTFMENKQVTLLDVYNASAYPRSQHTRDRVNISVPLSPGCDGGIYLSQYQSALKKLDCSYRLAFVVAGSDTLASDKIGGMGLSIDEVVQRELLTLQALREQGTPVVMLGGGGYSKDSAECVKQSILKCARF